MAIVLHNGSTAGLFDRLGVIFGIMRDVNSIRGGTATTNVGAGANMVTRTNNLDTYYGASPQNKKVLDGVYTQLSSWQSTQTGFLSYLRTLAQNTVVEMANDDTPLASKTLSNALALLIQQMTTSVDSVNASAPVAGAQTAVGSPTGNTILAISVKGPTGVDREYILPEKLTFTCTGDAGRGSTARREPFTVTSPAAQADALSQDWPDGSGITVSLNVIDSAQDATSGGNLLTNGDMESFTSNTPDSWTVLVGVAGTDIFDAGSGYTGTHGLKFFGVGGVPLSSIAQTLTSLQPNKVYAFNCFMKKSAGLTGNGNVEVSLVDGSNTIIQSDAAVDLKISQDASDLTGSYASVRGFFQTPKSLPATVKLRVRMNVAIADAGESVFIDDLALTPATELYTGGPYAALFAGSTNPLLNDAWTSTITNTWGVFQQMFEQVFSMKSLGLQLPSDASAAETIPDSYVA